MLPPSCSSIVCTRIKELGSLCSLSATSITRKTATPNVPRTKPTQWMVSSSDNLPRPMPSWSTTPGINVTTNPIATNSTRIAYLHLFILLLFMTAVYLFPSIATTLPPSANRTLRVRELLNPVLATMQSSGLALLWTFPWTRPHLRNMSSSSMTAPPNQCRRPKWPLSSPSQPTPPPIHPTFSHHSSD